LKNQHPFYTPLPVANVQHAASWSLALKQGGLEFRRLMKGVSPVNLCEQPCMQQPKKKLIKPFDSLTVSFSSTTLKSILQAGQSFQFWSTASYLTSDKIAVEHSHTDLQSQQKYTP